jgi:hypothetical protein
MSTSGDRWAYLDGSAYLLGFLFFLGRGEDVARELEEDMVDWDIAISAESWVRLSFRIELDALAELCDAGVVEYWNFANLPLKVGGDWSS